MKKLGRILIAWALGATCCLAAAQEWPSKPIRLMVGFPPGGAIDATARIVGDELSKILGQPVIVENKPGAGGVIGAQAVVHAPADGYTLLVTPDATLFAPDFLPTRPFQVEDFAPITVLTSQPVVLVASPSLGVKSVQELVALAKAKPDSLAFGTTAAPAGTLEFAANTFFRTAGISLRKIPYKGGSLAVQDLIGGQIPVAVLAGAPLVGPAKAGKVVLLAVTSKQRSPSMPDVPTLAESGYPSVDISQWVGVLAPVGTPPPVLSRLSAAFNKALTDAEVKKRLAAVVLKTEGGTPDGFAQRIRIEAQERRQSMKQVTSK